MTADAARRTFGCLVGIAVWLVVILLAAAYVGGCAG